MGERNLDLRGRHDQRFRHRADLQRHGAKVPRLFGTGDGDAVGSEPVDGHSQLELSAVRHRQLEFAAGAADGAAHRRALPEKQHLRAGDCTPVRVDEAAGHRAAVHSCRRGQRNGKCDDDAKKGSGSHRAPFRRGTRRCLGEAEKDEPGVEYPGLRIVTCIPNLPAKKQPSQWLPANPAGGCSSPLTVAAPRGSCTHFARPPGRTGNCESLVRASVVRAVYRTRPSAPDESSA